MSCITRFILVFSVMENEAARLADINRYLNFTEGFTVGGESPHHSPAAAILVPEEATSGTKAFSDHVIVGAYNYLQSDLFMRHLLEIGWEDVEYVRLFLQHEQDEAGMLELFQPCRRVAK